MPSRKRSNKGGCGAIALTRADDPSISRLFDHICMRNRIPAMSNLVSVNGQQRCRHIRWDTRGRTINDEVGGGTSPHGSGAARGRCPFDRRCGHAAERRNQRSPTNSQQTPPQKNHQHRNNNEPRRTRRAPRRVLGAMPTLRRQHRPTMPTRLPHRRNPSQTRRQATVGAAVTYSWLLSAGSDPATISVGPTGGVHRQQAPMTILDC